MLNFLFSLRAGGMASKGTGLKSGVEDSPEGGVSPISSILLDDVGGGGLPGTYQQDENPEETRGLLTVSCWAWSDNLEIVSRRK